ncbi:hypothetical protein CYMTET_31989 [Cymbomonas tetramitiformis]|uniref:Uncharacterized protein n=1 Tax=Cymbomonas tetramitiformis TaxID=36881 RepID=A0AAE0KSC3_9CHLO|nr:hypothetical protein CYMTET_31989 [Cymbomonas tetramitiformis]
MSTFPVRVEEMETRGKAEAGAGNAGRYAGPQWDALSREQLRKKLVKLQCVEHFSGVKPYPERPKNLEFDDMPMLYYM